MRDESERINAQLNAARWQDRIAKINKIVDSFRFSLPHPHDFSPSAADICCIPEVRKAIVDGTDEEFQDCKADIQPRIPELSTTWLEERRKVFLQLLPQNPPRPEHLSLATTLFDCMKCYEFGMRIEESLSHRCRCRHDDEYRAKFPSINSANVFYSEVGAPWNSGLAEYRYSAQLSAFVREVVLECGENPDTITTKEMNRKHHRFVRFGRDGAITVLSWFETVSSSARSLEDTTSDLYAAVSSSTSANTEAHRFGSSGLTNCQNMHLNQRTKGANGVASTAGEQVPLNGVTNRSPPSKITSLVRKFLPMCKHRAYTEHLLTSGSI